MIDSADDLRALTLTQPWCGLMASGIKLIENRSKPILRNGSPLFGKRFCLHASREVDLKACARIAETAPELRMDPATGLPLITDPLPQWWPLGGIRSAIIATATLADALYIGGNSEETTVAMLDKVFGPGHNQLRWTFGPTCYVFSDIRALATPVPARGFHGFWKCSPEVATAVRRQGT